MKLQTKVIILFALLFLLSGILIVLFSKRIIHDVLINEVGKRGLLKTEDLPKSTATAFLSGDELALVPTLRKGMDQAAAVYAIALDPNGFVLAHVSQYNDQNLFGVAVVQQLPVSRVSEYRQIVINNKQFIDVSLPVISTLKSNVTEEDFLLMGKNDKSKEYLLGTLHMGLPLETILDTEKVILNKVIWIFNFTGGASLILSLLTTRRMIKRIRRMVKVTERIGKGEYGLTISDRSRDELGDLAKSFNKMSGRLARRDELILNSAGEGILGLDLEGKVTFVNPAALRMLSYDNEEELVGRPMHELIHHTREDGTPYPTEECPINTTIAERNIQSVVDDLFWKKEGDSFPVEYMSSPIVEQNKTEGAVVVFRDIS